MRVILFAIFIATNAWSFSSNVGSEKVGVPSSFKPQALQETGISEHLGALIDGSIGFVDESGKEITLSHYFSGTKPILLSLVYYSCPNLCNLHLNGVTNSIKRLDLSLGKDFEMLVVSIDPKEKSDLASSKRTAYLKDYGREGTENSWHFLTGKEESIKRLTSTVGFNYKWDEKTSQWIHASSLIVLTPSGVVSKYLHGIDFPEVLLKLSLIEASEGKIGTLVDRLALVCMNYASQLGSKTGLVMNLVRAFSVTLLLIIGFAIWRLGRKKGR